VVVYDTLAQRNPAILRLCRQYLHHVQRSVFEGHLSPAQLRKFHHGVKGVIDPGYDSVLVFTFPPGTTPTAKNGASPNPPPPTSCDNKTTKSNEICSKPPGSPALPEVHCKTHFRTLPFHPPHLLLYIGVLIAPERGRNSHSSASRHYFRKKSSSPLRGVAT
jgi:CRISPR-associated protein Cas2